MTAGSSESTRAVETANTAFYNAVEGADMDLLSAVWAEGTGADGVMCIHPGWPPVRGRNEVLRSFALILANMPYIQFFLTDVDIQVAGDVAVVSCMENTLTALQDEDDPAVGFAGGRVVATNVFRRGPQGWRLWLHHASPVIALDEDSEDADDSVGLADDDDLFDFPDEGSPDSR